MDTKASGKVSSSSSSVTHARAIAEAAKVRAEYATKEARLKIEKATRDAERIAEKAAREAETIIRDTQSQLETLRIDTELEVLTSQREADAAVVQALVWEQAEAMDVVDEMEESVSEKVKTELECTSEYVLSQID